jgi:hypothetical protein
LNRPLFPPVLLDDEGELASGVQLPAVFAPDQSHPLVDDFTLRAARMRARQQPPGISPVYPLPMRSHPMWAGSSELGQEVAFAADVNNRQTVLKLEEWGPPKIWTVALGLNYDANRTPDPAFSVAAEIQFGVGGVVQQVEVDFRQGSAITVVANSIVVNALYPFGGVSGAVVPSDLVLRVSLSQMPAGNAVPTRSYRVTHPATTPIMVVPVPPFAKDVFVGVTNPGTVNAFTFATNALISFQHGTDDSPSSLAAMVYPATQTYNWLDFANTLVGSPAALPVPEGARSLAVIWAPGGVPANPPAQFNWRAQFRIGL